jgi:hypothetical protein
MLGQEEGKITLFCRWFPASTEAIRIGTMDSAEGFSDDVMCPFSGYLLQRTQNHPTVTLDQEQKEELFHEFFDEYGDCPIPEK